MKEIIILVILTGVNAILAMAEVAFLSVNKTKVHLHAKKGFKKAIRAEKILANSSTVLATIQIGITFAGFFASAFAADTYADALVEKMSFLNINLTTIHSLVVVIITVILSYFNLVFGELFPKEIAMYHPERITYALADGLNIMSKVFYPFVWILSKSTELLCKIFRIRSDSKEKVTEEDIKLMIYEGHKAGSIETDEKNYMYNVLSFNDKKIKDIMRKKEQIVTIDIDSNTKEILEKIKASKYSRMPVYMDTIDNIVGILSIKDLVVARANNELIDIKDVLREPTFVSENAIIDDVFRDMQKEQHGMAIVQDKHHKTLGIVTLEDIIEEILGEIYDEHEKRESAKENIEK